MKEHLELGIFADTGRPWTLPTDLTVETLAIIGIRGSGKTTTATVVAEEMLECGLAPISIDPVGVWWGLRCKTDGSPGGYPIVVLGGPRGDLPLNPGKARKICAALIEENVPAVIDLSRESKKVFRHFVTEFCDELMEISPGVPRHIFIEEAPELVPQRPMGEQQRSKAAVDRLLRLGRNNGYGGSLISQRYATIDKDVLTQCGNILALRMIGKTDRDAAEAWIGEVVEDTESAKHAAKFMKGIASMENGEAWWFSPNWQRRFDHVRIRPRKTLHPGATRKMGDRPQAVALSDVGDFMSRLTKILAEKDKDVKTHDLARQLKSPAEIVKAIHNAKTPSEAIRAIDNGERDRLRERLAVVERELATTRMSLAAVQELLLPDYQKFKKIFGEMGSAIGVPGGASPGPQALTQRQDGQGGMLSGDLGNYEPFRKRLGPKPMEMIKTLIDHGGQLTRAQLGTLVGLPYKGSTYVTYLKRLRSVGFIETPDKENVRLLSI